MMPRIIILVQDIEPKDYWGLSRLEVFLKLSDCRQPASRIDFGAPLYSLTGSPYMPTEN
jgi:hypothetical protein